MNPINLRSHLIDNSAKQPSSSGGENSGSSRDSCIISIAKDVYFKGVSLATSSPKRILRAKPVEVDSTTESENDSFFGSLQDEPVPTPKRQRTPAYNSNRVFPGLPFDLPSPSRTLPRFPDNFPPLLPGWNSPPSCEVEELISAFGEIDIVPSDEVQEKVFEAPEVTIPLAVPAEPIPVAPAEASTSSSVEAPPLQESSQVNAMAAKTGQEQQRLNSLGLLRLSKTLKQTVPDLSGYSYQTTVMPTLKVYADLKTLVNLRSADDKFISIEVDERFDRAVYNYVEGKQECSTQGVIKNRSWRGVSIDLLGPIAYKSEPNKTVLTFALPEEFLSHPRVNGMIANDPSGFLTLVGDLFKASLMEFLPDQDIESIPQTKTGESTPEYSEKPISEIIKSNVDDLIELWNIEDAELLMKFSGTIDSELVDD